MTKKTIPTPYASAFMEYAWQDDDEVQDDKVIDGSIISKQLSEAFDTEKSNTTPKSALTIPSMTNSKSNSDNNSQKVWRNSPTHSKWKTGRDWNRQSRTVHSNHI